MRNYWGALFPLPFRFFPLSFSYGILLLSFSTFHFIPLFSILVLDIAMLKWISKHAVRVYTTTDSAVYLDYKLAYRLRRRSLYDV